MSIDMFMARYAPDYARSVGVPALALLVVVYLIRRTR